MVNDGLVAAVGSCAEEKFERSRPPEVDPIITKPKFDDGLFIQPCSTAVSPAEFRVILAWPVVVAIDGSQHRCADMPAPWAPGTCQGRLAALDRR